MKVTLIASHTEDRIVNRDIGTKQVRSGGPARYCTQPLQDYGMDVELITGLRNAIVKIEIKSGKEEIWVSRIDPIVITDSLPSDHVLISPILSEFKLEQLSRHQCMGFLDAQGYIRTQGRDKRRYWHCDLALLDQIIALKVNEGELQFTSSAILQFFMRRTLIITKGARGIEIGHKNQQRRIAVNALMPTDTLGGRRYLFRCVCSPVFIQ